jgi:hypothetical protein
MLAAGRQKKESHLFTVSHLGTSKTQSSRCPVACSTRSVILVAVGQERRVAMSRMPKL